MSKKVFDIVIDASVARSAGETIHPISKSCRDFLEDFRSSKNILVMSKTIFAEWKKHQSRFSSTWRNNIIASKRLKVIDDIEYEQIRTTIDKYAPNDKAKDAILKDVHLVEAAIQTDEIIISCDNKMRVLLYNLTSKCGDLKNIVWVNPVNPYESASEWIQNGCPKDQERKLLHFMDSVAATSQRDHE
ncbi:hypothetical protein [Paenibacillus sinopodophylli]|uniref:hypothetical protein n=1 Tax=Paenibacillus sinopodophylli TaxID=1837342 RepID=UPI00110D230F|nr:hypothetical protein [Paenibacillus sinopodophylli]